MKRTVEGREQMPCSMHTDKGRLAAEALDQRTQSRPSSTASPKKMTKGGFGEAFMSGFLSRQVPHDFKGGLSVYEVATRYGLTILVIEDLIRNAMKRLGA